MFSLRTRLMGLALGPALLALGFAATTVDDRLAAADAAASVAQDIDVVVDVVEVQSSLTAARIPVEVQTRIGGNPSFEALPDALVQWLLVEGPTPDEWIDQATAALRAIPAAERPVALEDIAQLGDTTSRPEDQAAGLRAMSDALTSAVGAQLSGLREDVLGLRRPDLTEELLRLSVAATAYGAAGPRLEALATITVAGLDGDPVDPADIAELSRHAATFDTTMVELQRMDPTMADLVVPRLDHAVHAVTAGDRPDVVADGDVMGLASLFLEGIDQHEGLHTAVTESSEGLRGIAGDLAAAAQREALLLGTLVALLLGGMAAGTYVLVRTVERPLSSLIGRTRLVGAGHLDDLPPPVDGGPAEIVAAARAFDDVVSNLRLLEGKVRALANCAFDDPILDQRLPGPLGEELAKSVMVLSGSIHDRTELQDRLAYQATHDGLTGLPNRASAIEALSGRIARARRRGQLVAVAFLDLDGFKRANDTYGHALGDEVLRQVAARLREESREVDFVARLGGDEFVVVFEDADDVPAALAAARRIAEAIAVPIEHDGRRVRISASIGLAFAMDGQDDALELLGKADLAVYRAKSSDTPVAMFDEALQEELRKRTSIEAALREELATGGPNLELHYQPIIRSADESLRGFEALIRWRGPDGQMIPPGDFVPVAEDSQLVVDLDRWVLTTALRQLTEWENDPRLAHVDLSVNVSGRHVLSREFAGHVREALAAVDVSPDRLIIEVTETVLLDDLVVAVENLQEVRDLGVRVAVDDFGTGYTSLAHLRRLPMDELKIDRSFLSDLAQSHNRDLVRTVNELARHVGVPTVAEGIETDEQYAFLREIGCDDVQGFLFGRPTPARELAVWLAGRPAAVCPS